MSLKALLDVKKCIIILYGIYYIISTLYLLFTNNFV
jgi:hypothetical protein